VTQPLPEPFRKGGAFSSRLAVTSTWVSPNLTRHDPSAWRAKPGGRGTARIWSGARPPRRSPGSFEGRIGLLMILKWEKLAVPWRGAASHATGRQIGCKIEDFQRLVSRPPFRATVPARPWRAPARGISPSGGSLPGLGRAGGLAHPQPA